MMFKANVDKYSGHGVYGIGFDDLDENLWGIGLFSETNLFGNISKYIIDSWRKPRGITWTTWITWNKKRYPATIPLL